MRYLQIYTSLPLHRCHKRTRLHYVQFPIAHFENHSFCVNGNSDDGNYFDSGSTISTVVPLSVEFSLVVHPLIIGPFLIKKHINAYSTRNKSVIIPNAHLGPWTLPSNPQS